MGSRCITDSRLLKRRHTYVMKLDYILLLLYTAQFYCIGDISDGTRAEEFGHILYQ